MANILVNIEKGVEIAAEDALKFITGANALASKAGPGAIAAFAVLAGAVEKALTDVAADTNPTTLTLNLPTTVSDIKAVWPSVVSFLATLGIKV